MSQKWGTRDQIFLAGPPHFFQHPSLCCSDLDLLVCQKRRSRERESVFYGSHSLGSCPPLVSTIDGFLGNNDSTFVENGSFSFERAEAQYQIPPWPGSLTKAAFAPRSLSGSSSFERAEAQYQIPPWPGSLTKAAFAQESLEKFKNTKTFWGVRHSPNSSSCAGSEFVRDVASWGRPKSQSLVPSKCHDDAQ